MGCAPPNQSATQNCTATVEVELRDADPTARVHIVARRFVPESNGAARLALDRPPALDYATVEARTLDYLAQRPIGDEQRYILARRFAPRYVGNLLERGGLLLQPWSIEDTDLATTEIGIGAGGGGGRSGRRAGTFRGPGDSTGTRGGETNTLANFDFLPSPARVRANLVPDVDGVVRVPFADLGLDAGLHHVEAIAVDRSASQRAQAALASVPFEPRDRRLAAALPDDRVWGEKRDLTIVRTGALIGAPAHGTVERRPIAGLGAMFETFLTLHDGPQLRKFEFLTRWSGFTRDEKLVHYGEFACHELHVFLRLKDRPFFDEVVRPYLANKGEPTFLDEWLLDGDVRPWLDTGRFGKLNTAEQVLLLEFLGEPGTRMAREINHVLARGTLDHADLRWRFESALLGAAATGVAQGGFGEAMTGDSDFFLGQGQRDADSEPRDRSAGPTTGGLPSRGSVEVSPEEVEEVEPAISSEMPFDNPNSANTEAARDVERRAAVRGITRDVGDPTELTVLASAPPEDSSSFAAIAARGSDQDVLAALTERDLGPADVGAIAWRMRDAEFFTASLDVLRSRFVYHHTLWGYALRHEDPRAAAEYLARTPFSRAIGPWLRSDLLVIDPHIDRAVEFEEFAPRVNSRAHPEAGLRGVRDAQVEARYRELLRIWELKPALEPRDRLELAYHHLLEKRIHDALGQLGRVERGAVTTALQHDYMLAHAAFFTGDAAAAKRFAEPHRNHPVARWRGLFRGILDVAALAEIGAVANSLGAGPALGAPLLELELNQGNVALTHAGLKDVEVNFYSIDLEFRFSADPFGDNGGQGTGHVRPHASLRVPGSGERSRAELVIPAELVATSLVVEARGGGIVRRALHQPSALSVDRAEQSGRLVVRDGARPAAAVYVKVYSRSSTEKVLFYKDGYTDVLGRFDYASVSGPRGDIARFAILVLDERRGAAVREATPPPR